MTGFQSQKLLVTAESSNCFIRHEPIQAISTTLHLSLATDINGFERIRNAKFVLGQNSGSFCTMSQRSKSSDGSTIGLLLLYTCEKLCSLIHL